MEKFENVSFAIYPVIYRSMYCTEEEKEAFDAFISSLKNRKGQKVFYEGENKNWLYVKAADIVELKSPKKCKEGFLPYYDMDALRNIGNPNWIQRTGFKFNDSSNDPKKRVNIEIRNNRAYIDNGHLCEKGELLLSATGTIGDTFICPEKCYITPSFKIVKFKYDLIENDFFKFWVLQHKNQMLSDVESVYVPNLNKKTFNEYLFPIPPKKEQSQISEKLKTYFSLLDKL